MELSGGLSSARSHGQLDTLQTRCGAEALGLSPHLLSVTKVPPSKRGTRHPLGGDLGASYPVTPVSTGQWQSNRAHLYQFPSF